MTRKKNNKQHKTDNADGITEEQKQSKILKLLDTLGKKKPLDVASEDREALTAPEATSRRYRKTLR